MNTHNTIINILFTVLFICLYSCTENTSNSFFIKIAENYIDKGDKYIANISADTLAIAANEYLHTRDKHDRNYFIVRQMIVISYFKNKEYDNALKVIKSTEKVHELNNFDDIKCRYNFLRARGEQLKGNNEEAIIYYKKCIEIASYVKNNELYIASTVADAMLYTMNIYQTIGRYRDCVTYLESLNNKSVNFIRNYCYRDLLSILAYSYYRADMMKDSENMIRKALDIKCDNYTSEKLFRDYSYAGAIFYANPQAQDKVIEYSKKAIHEAEKANLTRGLQWTTTMLGGIYQKMGKMDDAINLYNYSLDIAFKNKDISGEVNAYNSLASLYLYWNFTEHANEYADKGIIKTIEIKEKNPSLVGNVFMMKGNVMKQMDLPDSAMYYWGKADSCFLNLPYNIGTVDLDKQIGSFLVDNYSDSRMNDGMRRLIRITDNDYTGYNRAIAFFNLAKGYIKQNNTSKAEIMLDSMYVILNKPKEPVYIPEAYRFAFNYYIKGNNIKNIKRYSESFIRESDFMLNDNISKKVTEAMIQYKTEKKEQQLLLAESELNNKELRIIIYTITSIALTLLLVGLTMFFIYKRKLYRTRRKLSEKKISDLINKIEEVNKDKHKVEITLDEFLSDNDNYNRAVAVVPEMLRTDGESIFRTKFSRLYPSFIPSLRNHVPNITQREEILSMLIVLDQTTEQIVDILCIEKTSVNMARHRLRKKIEISKEDSLEDFLKSMM